MPLSQDLITQGFAIVPDVLTTAECDALADRVAGSASASGGTRNLLQQDWCRALAYRLRQHPLLQAVLQPRLAPGMVAVQCTYFEKSSTRNWLVPVHQDLSIPVARRLEHPGLGPWSEKEGALFVQPPADLLQQLIAVRLHIDVCTADDGPLRVVAGSHQLGKLDAQATTTARQAQPEQVCAVPQGGAMLMHPLLLHASSKSTGHSRRRVLHFLFGPTALPLGLAWQDTA